MGLKETFDLPPAELPPPAYSASDRSGGFPMSVWIRILSFLMADEYERYELYQSVRLVSRTVYSAAMHILRNRYATSYSQRVQAPFSSDTGGRREVRALDHFIGLCLWREKAGQESELLLNDDDDEGEYDDLFSWAQPQARTEDLLAPQLPPNLDFHDITLRFRIRSVALLLPVKTETGRVIRRQVVEIQRQRTDSLEQSATQVARQVTQLAIVRNEDARGGRWYEVVGRAA